MRNWMETNVPRRLLSLVLSAAMVLSLLPAPSFAAESGVLCEHHTEHTDCGYKAAVEGQDCGHVHDEACGYAEASDCGHSHDDTCGYRKASPCTHQHTEECGEEGVDCGHQHDEACGYQEASDCTHSHDDTCGYREPSPCNHEHDDTCGYVEAVAGQPCGFVCEACAGEESKPTEPQPEEKTDKVITDWAWVDPDEWLDETGSFAMPGVTEDFPAYFEDVVEYLPTQITADGGEVLTLGVWACETYPMETGTSRGEYVFETTLPTGYILSDGGNVLRVGVTVAPVDLTEGPEAAAYADNIPYLDYTGNTQTCTSAIVVTGSDTVWSDGWYVASGSVTIGTEEAPQRVTISGNVHLILADGCDLTVNGGIGVSSGNSLTIYAQSAGENMGKLTVQNVNILYAGIGGDVNCSGGTIIINGGTVTATGGEWAAGIGGGDQGSGGTITINGGNVYADGAYGSVGIGGGRNGTGGNITISGGNVTATGGTTAAGIGGSDSGSGGEITISGNAIVNATGGMLAAGIGGGSQSAGGIITISGGTVTANGGSSAAGIGGGTQGTGGNITISGGTVTATGNSYGAGIGGGGSNWANGGAGGIITISGGTVTATGGQNGGAGIGGGQGASTSGGSGTFSTGTNGSAVIYASSISDTSSQGSWSGIIFEGDNGTVYGDQTLTEDLTIEAGKALTVPAGAKLTIPEGVTLTSNGTITNNGTIINNGTINGTITGNQPSVSVKYLDANGTEITCDSATVVTDSNTAWGGGWYVAQGNVTIDSRVTVSGEVHLILADGCNLTVSGGIGVNENNSLTIYAQSTGENMGKLIATSSDGAGIGGDSNSNGNGHNGGTITINGGKVTATGGEWAAGIGGGAGSFGDGGSGGNITINGGIVTATSSDGAGIGGGMSNYTGGSGGNITINGGTVTATGSSYGAGIGGGSGEDGGNGGTITINGGTVTATSSIRSAGIGGGHGLSGGSGGTIIIRGGTVTANGGQDGGAGIGDSKNGSGGTFSTGENGTAVIFASSISDTSKKDSWGGSVYFPLNLTDCTASGDVSDYQGTTYGKTGGSITLTAQPSAGQMVTGWQSDDVNVIDGSFTMPDHAVTVTAVFGDIVASVTDGEAVTNYVSFPDAFDAANRAADSTLKLHADVTAASELRVNGSFTLDLNGKTLTMGGNSILVNGGLTLKGAAEGSSIVGNGCVFLVRDSLTIESGSISGGNESDGCIINSGDLTIKGGQIRGTNCITNGVAGTLTVEGGTLHATGGYCVNSDSDVATITGGTLTAEPGAYTFQHANGITLQGGTFPKGISICYGFGGGARNMLEHGFAFYDYQVYSTQAGKQTLVSVGDTQMSIDTGVVVLSHPEHSFTTYAYSDDDWHTATCGCGHSMMDPHRFDGNGFCYKCDAYQPVEGEGPEYRISNAGQLFWFADYASRNDEPFNVSLTQDITIPEKKDGTKRQWTPIGADNKPYVGEFNGNGYTVSGLYITNQEDYSSFFGVVRGSIRDLTIADSQIDEPSGLHSIAAGICGVLQDGEILNCTNRADISCRDMQSAAGICVDNHGRISGCTNTGTISGQESANVGGICVRNEGIVENCTNSGQIQSGGIAGGICAMHLSGEIKNCANRGRVNGDGNAAGICGRSDGTVSYCYNIGDVITPSSRFTPIICINNGQADNCYYLANEESDEIDGTTFKTQKQFASGEVAYLLNNTEAVWGQRIGEERYPVLGGEQVYHHNSCPIYSNSPEESNFAHTPNVENNRICDICGAALVATVAFGPEGAPHEIYGYRTLQDAFAAADRNMATITLLEDVNIGDDTLTVTDGEVTFNGGEYTLTADGMNSAIDVAGGTFHFDSGTLQTSGAQDGIYVSDGTLNFRGGTIRNESRASIRINIGKANISGGTVRRVDAGDCILNISDGFIEVLSVRYARTALSGGSFRRIDTHPGKVSDLLAEGYAYYLDGRWVDAFNGNNASSLDEISIQVLPVPVKIETQPADTTLTYGEDKSLSVSASSTRGDISYQWFRVEQNVEGSIPVRLEGEIDSTLPLSKLNAGSHSIYCKLTCDGYVLDSNTVTVNVNKVIVTPPTVSDKVYNGQNQTADVTVDEHTPYTVTANPGGTAVGESHVTLTLKDPSNYKWSDSEEAEKTISFQITRAGNSWTTEPAIDGWTYGETAKTPTYEAEFGTVKVEYTSDSINYSEAVPTNAGSYKARFTVEGTDNYGSLSEEKDFTISPKAITATITPNGGTYGNVTPATAVLNGVVSGDTVPVTLTYTGTANDGTVYDSTATPSKAGSYTVTASIGDSNYNLTGTITATFVIQKLTVETPDNVSKTYNGENQTTGIVETDYYNADTTSGKDADTYNVQLALKDPHNCQWDERGGKLTFTIEKATNGWIDSPRHTNWTYGDNPNIDDGRPIAGTTKIEYSTDGGETYSTTVPTDAGKYKIRFTVTDKNYQDLVAEKDITIDKRHLTITWGSTTSFPYDGKNHQPTTEAGNVVSGDNITLVVSGAQKNVGKHTATVTGFTAGEGTKAGNYTLPSINLSTLFSIQAKALTVANVRVKDKQYDGQNSAEFDGKPTLKGVIGSDDVTLVNGTPTFKTVGVGNGIEIEFTTDFSLEGTASGNYTLTQPASVKANITPKHLLSNDMSFTLLQNSFVYDGTEKTANVTVQFGSTTLVEGTDYTLSGDTATNVGKYTLTITGMGNYSGTNKMDWGITRASITPAVTIADVVYGTTPNPSVSGNPGNGDVTYSYYSDANCTTEVTPKNVGTYYVKAAVTQTDNYQSGTSNAVSFQITKAPLTVTAKNHTITYGDAPANDGVEYSDFVPGESPSVLGGTLTYTYSYSQYGDVGSSYTITPEGLSSDNYNITFAVGTLTVQKKEIGISWGNTQFTYSGSAQMPTATPTGMVNNDAITLTVSGAQTNAGSDYTATVTAIQGDKAGNYALPQSVTTTFSIAQKKVTIHGVAVEATKVYDGTSTARIKYPGYVREGDLTLRPGSATYDTKDVGEGKTVTFSGFALSGSGASNYTLTQPDPVKADITPRPVTIQGATVAATKVYDGEEAAAITDYGALTNTVTGDDVTLDTGNAAAAYTDRNVGTGKNVTFSGFALSGSDAGNYSLTQPTSVTADITAKAVTITGTAVEATKVYDGSTTAQITSDGTLSANYDGSNLTLVRGSATYDTKDVGQGKTVTFSGYALSGSAAGNYTLTQPASVKADITAKEVTIAVTVKDKPFDGTTTGEIDTLTPDGIVSGDSVQVVNGTPTFARSTPGADIPVSFTEFALTGDDAGNYQLTQPTGIAGKIQSSSRYLNLAGKTDFTGHTEIWVDGVKYPIETEGGCYVNLPDTGDLLTVYTYQKNTSDLAHDNYPTGMAVYRITRTENGATVENISAFSDLLQYSGSSIRITGKRGIRMITSLTKGNKSALTGSGLAGYTLEEYGTVVQWADTLGAQSLTLDTGKHNYAYKKGVSDPVFANVGNLTQYTNVLVWNSLTNEQLGKDIIMRPYMILKDGSGNTVTLYGGCVSRSIGYIAYQNRAVFNPGTAAYRYVWDIIHAVYGTQYDSEYRG